jgi:hypothetical protein
MDRYITQSIEHSEEDWWEVIYLYIPSKPGGDTFFLHAVTALHSKDKSN